MIKSEEPGSVASVDDFPAAHSMDTTWFAVDRDGQIASFQTGHAGAVPDRACRLGRSSEEDDLLEGIGRLPASEVIYDWKGRLPAGLPPLRGPAVFFLTSPEPVRAELDSGQAQLALATAGHAVLFADLNPEVARRLVDDASCLGSFNASRNRRTLASHGLFVYAHADRWENWVAGPYGRRELPATPLHVDQVSAALREAVGRTYFAALAFDATPHLQPVEHLVCSSNQANYVTVAGELRPLPGRELAFLRNYRALHEDAAAFGLRLAPPAPPPGGPWSAANLGPWDVVTLVENTIGPRAGQEAAFRQWYGALVAEARRLHLQLAPLR